MSALEVAAPITRTGGTIAQALDTAWSTIRANHPAVPDAVLITGTGSKGKGVLKRGHWHPTRWTGEGEPIAEVFLAGERIAEGPDAVLATLLHEATHGACHAEGIKDTSRQGRYHNKRFAGKAVEHGLCPPEAPCARLGFSDCTLTDQTRERYTDLLTMLGEVLEVSIGTPQLVMAAPIVKARPRLVVACGCRERSVTEKQWEELSPIICGLCESRFVETM